MAAYAAGWIEVAEAVFANLQLDMPARLHGEVALSPTPSPASRTSPLKVEPN